MESLLYLFVGIFPSISVLFMVQRMSGIKNLSFQIEFLEGTCGFASIGLWRSHVHDGNDILQAGWLSPVRTCDLAYPCGYWWFIGVATFDPFPLRSFLLFPGATCHYYAVGAYLLGPESEIGSLESPEKPLNNLAFRELWLCSLSANRTGFPP